MPKASPAKVPSPSTTPRRKADLAPPNGPWIMRTTALKKYRLAASDLDSIPPISESRNPMGGTSLVRKYNECDVRALAEKLKTPVSSPSREKAVGPSLTPDSGAGTSSNNVSAESSSSAAVPPHLVPMNGPKILRSRAMKEYGLKSVQMDRIKPISIEPNPHRSGSSMRYYNLCDVKGLVDSIASAAASPSKRTHSYDDNYYDFNPFDGLSRVDAAELLYKKTGIVDSSIFCDDEY